MSFGGRALLGPAGGAYSAPPDSITALKHLAPSALDPRRLWRLASRIRGSETKRSGSSFFPFEHWILAQLRMVSSFCQNTVKLTNSNVKFRKFSWARLLIGLNHWLSGSTRTIRTYAYLCVAYSSTDFLAVEADSRQRRCEFVELESVENSRFAGRIQAEHGKVNRMSLQLCPVDTHRNLTCT